MIPTMTGLLAFASEGGFNPLDPSVWPTYFWTIVIFVLAIGPMWFIVFGPITEALYARDKMAEDAISEANESKASAEKAQTATEAALRDAREESKRQIRDAKDMAEKQKADVLAQAQREADAERSRVRNEIAAEKQKAIGEIRDLVVDLSMGASSKLLHREVGGEDQKAFVEGVVDDLAKSSTGN
jgi:F-type H+-transporting ATPase subunit b